MDIKEARNLSGDIAAHWYYRAKLAAMRAMIGNAEVREILDVGAGSGFFSRAMLRDTTVARATCVDPGYAADRDELVAGKQLLFRRAVDRSAADLVLMMDVLEHTRDDVGVLREYAAKVPSGARVLITVPAFNFLWSGHDVFLEHYRRYTLGGIERAVEAADLTILRGCYFYAAIFPLVAGLRLAARLRRIEEAEPRSDMREFSPAVNAALWAVCRAELSAFRFNRAVGLTAFVLAVKR